MQILKILLASSALAIPALAQADALQQQVVAAAKASGTDDLAFTQAIRVERTGEATRDIVQRYDPRGGAAKWTLIKVDGRAPNAKEMKDAAKRSGRGRTPSYSRIADWFGAPATRVATTPTSVTYRFAKLPKGALKRGPHDASENTSAEAVVNTAGRVPFVERVRLTSNAPFNMFMVVKVARFTVNGTNRLVDGRPVSDTTIAEFAGSFMGKPQTMRTRTTYADVRTAR